ncbi:hypothetical protein PGTUg99_032321 [Puccinia graminis f. sp. tritici]|uniref:Uncharacterized protein n=1 Tax=Puccinia graminis f. sp. tritici TaxID=56615 RepID=A0A5B0S7V2_PUCGR|nr:hypothetical protein PGTUg99_032321 [Puccinia graminis f. sp. tritici]
MDKFFSDEVLPKSKQASVRRLASRKAFRACLAQALRSLRSSDLGQPRELRTILSSGVLHFLPRSPAFLQPIQQSPRQINQHSQCSSFSMLRFVQMCHAFFS